LVTTSHGTDEIARFVKLGVEVRLQIRGTHKHPPARDTVKVIVSVFAMLMKTQFGSEDFTAVPGRAEIMDVFVVLVKLRLRVETNMTVRAVGHDVSMGIWQGGRVGYAWPVGKRTVADR